MGARITKNTGNTWVVRTRAAVRDAQHPVMASYAGTTRAIYNVVRYRLRRAWEQRQAEQTYDLPEADLTPLVPWGFEGMSAYYRAHRDTLIPWHRQIPSDVQEFALRNLADALARYRKGLARFPSSKKKYGPAAGLVPFSVKDHKTTWLTDGGRTARLPFAKGSRVEKHDQARLREVRLVADNRMRKAARLVREGKAQVQQVTWSFEGGYWWAAIRLRVLPSYLPQKPKPRAAPRGSRAGLDAGCGTTFATLDQPVPDLTDTEGKIPAAHHLKRSLTQLARAQERLARTTPGSNRHRKALTRVQRLHHKTASRRQTWHRQTAVRLAESFETIVIENLNLKGMIRKTKGFRFAKTLSDNAFGLFFAVLQDEITRRGGQLIRAGRFFPSSKLCSGCGTRHVSLTLSMRTYTCTTCGLILDRDLNAARNLAAYPNLPPDRPPHRSTQEGIPGHATSVGEPSSHQTPSPRGDDATAPDSTLCRPEGTRSQPLTSPVSGLVAAGTG